MSRVSSYSLDACARASRGSHPTARADRAPARAASRARGQRRVWHKHLTGLTSGILLVKNPLRGAGKGGDRRSRSHAATMKDDRCSSRDRCARCSSRTSTSAIAIAPPWGRSIQSSDRRVSVPITVPVARAHREHAARDVDLSRLKWSERQDLNLRLSRSERDPKPDGP